MKTISVRLCRRHRWVAVGMLAAVMATVGCDSGGNVLKPPEGEEAAAVGAGSTAAEAKLKEQKPKPGTSTRREREQSRAQ